MKKRIITAAVLIAILVVTLLLSEFVLLPIVLAAFSALAVFEIFRVIGVHRNLFLLLPAMIISALNPFIAFFLGKDGNHTRFFLVTATVFIAEMFWFFAVAVFAKGKLKIGSVCAALLLMVYVSLGFSGMTLLRFVGEGNIGLFCVVLIYVTACSSDTFALVFGKLLGRHKLIEAVSPKKTVEGSVAGVICSILASLLYGLIVGLATDLAPNYWALALLGLVLSVISQMGDLIASLVKREYGIKDYGHILPGHGGIMDRFDSIIAVSIPCLIICLNFPPFTI